VSSRRRNKEKHLLAGVFGYSSERVFNMERSVEEDVRRLLLTTDDNSRNSAYEKGYEKLHAFFQENRKMLPEQEFLYEPLTDRALSFKRTICKIVGKNKKVLEVGCGDGILSLAIALQGNNVIGADISDLCVSIADMNRQKLNLKPENVHFLQMSASKINFADKTFDFVISHDLLEHLHPSDALLHLSEVHRVLKVGGIYICVTPNRYLGFSIPAHLKEYTYHELGELMETFGFSNFRSTLLFHGFALNCIVPVTIKLPLEQVFRKFTNMYFIPTTLWNLLGLGYIFIICSKM